jgi:hypothetical protein
VPDSFSVSAFNTFAGHGYDTADYFAFGVIPLSRHSSAYHSKSAACPRFLFFCLPVGNLIGLGTKPWSTSHSPTVPCGSFDAPVSVAEVARSIGAGLAKAALAGRLDGELVDTSTVIERDARLAIVTDKDADGLEVIRHSTAHLLAYAVKELFPEAQVTIGPVIDNGFYYDFSYTRPFTPEDLERIEARMRELAARDEAVSREVWDRDDAVTFFRVAGRAGTRPRSSAPFRPASRFRCIARAASSTCAAARTCRPPAS